MNNTDTAKRSLAALYRLCPGRHILLLVSGALIAAHLLSRDCRRLMSLLSDRLVRPIHGALARLSGLLPFSLAEFLVVGFVLGLICYVLYVLITLRKRGWMLARLYIMLITLSAAALTVYAAFCLLWGVYYYGDSFVERTGFSEAPVSVEQLETVTEYFARLANEYGALVERDGQGACAIDRAAVLERSDSVYEALEARYPYLKGPGVRAKGLVFSRLLSRMDYTGFFFPFTGEANVNVDFPPSLFASTTAHELAHQRGVAQEQDANFVAVLASLGSGDAEYCYSAALLAYTHLLNALFDVDSEAARQIHGTLSDAVLLDFAVNRLYWEQFDSAVQDISNTLYESFLYSYEQELGLKSYGECVDLLVNYYYEDAVLN